MNSRECIFWASVVALYKTLCQQHAGDVDHCSHTEFSSLDLLRSDIAAQCSYQQSCSSPYCTEQWSNNNVWALASTAGLWAQANVRNNPQGVCPWQPGFTRSKLNDWPLFNLAVEYQILNEQTFCWGQDCIWGRSYSQRLSSASIYRTVPPLYQCPQFPFTSLPPFTSQCVCVYTKNSDSWVSLPTLSHVLVESCPYTIHSDCTISKSFRFAKTME